MLTEERYERILNMLAVKHSITIAEITETLQISESTARRDIGALARAGKLEKVFGGAVSRNRTVITNEPTVAQKSELHMKEKTLIARKAAGLIQKHDFIFLDAGTTTGAMIDYLNDTSVTYVTNAPAHAQRMAARGLFVILLGGEVKTTTEAVVGSIAMSILQKYHFSKGFFGVNGISEKEGLTTPDTNEAMIKEVAMQQCAECYVLADTSKFDKVSAATFAAIDRAELLTEDIPESYRDLDNIRNCTKL